MTPVILTAAALAQIRQLPAAILPRIDKLLERLEHWPVVSGVKPLRGKLAGHFRMRTGDYRLQFRVEGTTVIVEKIGHRRTFYED